MSDLLKPTDLISWAPKHLATEVGGVVILMSVDQGVYCELDDIGSAIWRRLATPATVAALSAAMVATYRGDPAQIQADIVELLTTLRTQGLIDVR